MALIEVSHVKKDFQVRSRKEGSNPIRELFSRSYETKIAVNDISFSIGKGEIVGYIGPNGAGKSTTIKMLTGILTPTSGTIRVNGCVPWEDRQKYTKRIGVVFGQRTQLWWDIPVYDSLDLMRYIYDIPKALFNENMALFTDILGIGDFLHTPTRQLSLGQRMRADLCAALLHNPDILYLDEPTIGLDAIVKKNVRTFIQEINRQRKTTIILTTHDMADIEKLCSRVIVIDKGSLIYDGSLSQVQERFGTSEKMELVLENEIQDFTWFTHNRIEVCKSRERQLCLQYDTAVINASRIIEHLMTQTRILDFEITGTEIEEAIRRMYLTSGVPGSTGKPT